MKSMPVFASMIAGFVLASAPAAAADEGQVKLPLYEWTSMVDEIEAADRPARPPIVICPRSRRIDGVFHKGLLRGSLTTSFEVLDVSAGHIRVPVLDGAASVSKVTLDGRRTSLLREGGMYTVGVDRAGVHEMRLEFFWGKEQDRFARRIRFRVPEAGTTEVSVVVPETDIEPKLEHGAFSQIQARARETALTGHLDATGLFDLSWSRRLTHRAGAAVRTEVRLNTLFTIHEAMVGGVASFDVEVLEGETDRVDLRLPPEIEVTRIEGESVLQWRTEARAGGRLTVLLRYLVEDRTRISVHFQFPVDIEKPIALAMPLPADGTPMSGAVGVQGPAGLDVSVKSLQRATALALRDLPPELADLTSSPLLLGFAFTEPPAIALGVSRHAQVEVTSTMVDELQASSVVIEDGTEVTKVKLRLRNNARQYLNLRLPAGTVLTHSLIDGQPVRPAVSEDERGELLLFPLRQSEKIGASGERIHVVRFGETLSDVANFYYSDPGQWQTILTGNEDRLIDERDLVVGQELRIPQPEGVTVEESIFVIELAYTARHDPLGNLGRLALTLPEIDVETLRATWHLYFPQTLEPMSFDANLTQLSAIRYDPFRRLRDFLGRALWIRHAWAGAKYKSILSQRKVIYREEAQKRASTRMVLSSFPLVGERYRFRRILLGNETPSLSLTYVARGAAKPIRWVAFLLALGLTLLLLREGRRRTHWIAAAAGLAVLLVFGHYVLGVHRRVVWGVDAALIVGLLMLGAADLWRAVREHLREPWRLLGLIRLRNLALMIGVCVLLWIVLALPLLLSSAGLVVLFLWWRFVRRGPAGKEVSHA